MIPVSLGFAIVRSAGFSASVNAIIGAPQTAQTLLLKPDAFRYVLVRRGEWFKGIGDLSPSAFSVAANSDEMQEIPGDDEGDLRA